jgi:hypothetical protein
MRTFYHITTMITALIKILLNFLPDDNESALEQYIIDGQPQNTGDIDMLTRQFHRQSTSRGI